MTSPAYSRNERENRVRLVQQQVKIDNRLLTYFGTAKRSASLSIELTLSSTKDDFIRTLMNPGPAISKGSHHSDTFNSAMSFSCSSRAGGHTCHDYLTLDRGTEMPTLPLPSSSPFSSCLPQHHVAWISISLPRPMLHYIDNPQILVVLQVSP